jgi:hypothetical protein
MHTGCYGWHKTAVNHDYLKYKDNFFPPIPKKPSKCKVLCNTLEDTILIWWGMLLRHSLFSILTAAFHIWKLSSPSPTWRNVILWRKNKRKIMGLISLLLNKNAVITTILQSVSDSHFTCKILVLYNNMHIIGFANIKSNYFLQFHYNQMLSVEYSIFTKINYETLHYYRLPFFVKRNVVHKLTLS